MKTLVLSVALMISGLAFGQAKPEKMKIFYKPVTQAGELIEDKELALNHTGSFEIRYAIQLATIENVSKIHLTLGNAQGTTNRGVYDIPFDNEENLPEGVTYKRKENTIHISVGKIDDLTAIYGTASVQYTDGSMSGKVEFIKE